MAQIDSNATLEQIAQMEREFARKRELAESRRAAELARLSEQRTTRDENGNTWTYLVVDDVEYGSGNRLPLWMFGFLY